MNDRLITTRSDEAAPIVDVVLKPLVSHGDERGFFREIIRFSDPFFERRDGFAQWSHSRMAHGVVKAWHYHHVQTDWWYVPIGQVETVLFDNRPESPTYRTKMVFQMGESHRFGPATREVCVRIPPGVLHGCKVLSDEAHLFYITSETYDPTEEGRFPFDSPLVGHDWGDNIIVADNDKRTFEPARPRRPLGRCD